MPNGIINRDRQEQSFEPCSCASRCFALSEQDITGQSFKMSASSSSYQLVTQQAKPPSDAQLHTYHQSTFEQTEHQPQSHYQDSQFSDELQGFEDIQAEDEAAFMTQQQVLNGHADSDLPPLQSQTVVDQNDKLEPISEDDPTSYELVEPPLGDGEGYSLEQRSLQLFSKEHLQVIFADGNYLLRFTSFLGAHRPQSVPTLIHYLDCLKALRAVQYSNAILEGLEPIAEVDSTKRAVKPTINADLEARADAAFAQLVKEELPAYITHQYIDIVSSSIVNRITGALAPHLREASEGLAEVFCLTDPSRPDNPIVFASEEFNRTTQYGMNYVLGRNCRFLQGPHTNPDGVRRFRETVAAGQPHHEILLNYRRDGSPFMNLLLSAPLTDSRGIVRYYIGAQVDVSGLIKDCVELESLSKLIELQERGLQPPCLHKPSAENEDPLRDLAEMLNQGELSTIIKFGGRMHRETVQTRDEGNGSGPGSDAGLSHQRLMIRDPEALTPPSDGGFSGRLGGIYQHVRSIPHYCRGTIPTDLSPVSPHPSISSSTHSLRKSVPTHTWAVAVTFPEQDRRVQPRAR